jgi:hypothetical protein
MAAADEHENRNHEAETHRLKGELVLRQDDSNLAEALRLAGEDRSIYSLAFGITAYGALSRHTKYIQALAKQRTSTEAPVFRAQRIHI